MLDPVYSRYLCLIGGIFCAIGLIQLFLKFALKKDIQSIWVIYKSWVWMTGLILVFVAFGRVATIIGLLLIAGMAFKEYARATGIYRDWWLTGTVYLSIFLVGVVTLMQDPRTGQFGWFGMFRTVPIYAVLLVLFVPILRNQAKGQIQATTLAIMGFIYLGWMFGHSAFLANSDHPYGYFLYLILAVELNDVAAFTFGKLFGRHPLRSEISPNKTWEGALGALGFSLVLPWLLGFSFPHFGPLQKILTGLIVGIGGPLGDLSISLLKRDIGIKDMGTTIPGHGGILDRIDSLIYTAPLYLHMINWFYGIYGTG